MHPMDPVVVAVEYSLELEVPVLRDRRALLTRLVVLVVLLAMPVVMEKRQDPAVEVEDGEQQEVLVVTVLAQRSAEDQVEKPLH